jgi:hypothetical protein
MSAFVRIVGRHRDEVAHPRFDHVVASWAAVRLVAAHLADLVAGDVGPLRSG